MAREVGNHLPIARSMVQMRKKLLSLSILALLVIGLVATLNLGSVGVSAADYPSVNVHPASTIDPGKTSGYYTVAINTTYTGLDITAYQFTLSYNPTVLRGDSVANGDIVDFGMYFFNPGTFDNTAGSSCSLLVQSNMLHRSAIGTISFSINPFRINCLVSVA